MGVAGGGGVGNGVEVGGGVPVTGSGWKGVGVFPFGSTMIEVWYVESPRIFNSGGGENSAGGGLDLQPVTNRSNSSIAGRIGGLPRA